MSLRKIFLRYYPPGIALSYTAAGARDPNQQHLKHIDLLDLNLYSNPSELAYCVLGQWRAHANASQEDHHLALNNHQSSEPIALHKSIEASRHGPEENSDLMAIKRAILKLQQKLLEPTKKKFYLYKMLQNHLLPLTNVCFDRSGERVLTGSYDRTCRIVNTRTTEEEQIMEHDNVVFSVAFNQPNCDKVVTASFDCTAKVWSAASGQCLCTMYGHSAELVSAEFHPMHAETVATASIDGSARIFNVETGMELQALTHHGAEIIASRFSRDGNLLLTGSFDQTAAVWDVRSKSLVAQLRGHTAELSNCIWNFNCDRIATGSLDSTARLWDLRRPDRSLFNINEHTDEVLDLAFDSTGKLLATSSSDCSARVWEVDGPLNLLSLMIGHSDEVSKVCFSPPGSMLMTASADHTARLWLTESGICTQVLTGHELDVFSCAFSYAGDIIVTASKDNTCRLWR